MALDGEWKSFKVLIKHPDYRQLIPGECVNRDGTILVEFVAKHPCLFSKFTFSNFKKDGVIYVGDRLYQIYKRDEVKENQLPKGTILQWNVSNINPRMNQSGMSFKSNVSNSNNRSASV